MTYLYGDSSPSPLTSNFLELLRDTLDFAVYVLQADDHIEKLHERTHAAEEAAREESERLAAFGRVVAQAIEGAPQGAADSETSRCAGRLAAACADAVRSSTAAVAEALAAQKAQAQAEEGSQREGCFKALEVLLSRHVPPESTLATRLERHGVYVARRIATANFGVSWRINLVVPPDHLFASLQPMEILAPEVEIDAPDQTGWIKKEVKMRPHRLGRMVLVEAVDDGQAVGLRLQFEPGKDDGLDFAVDPVAGVVIAARRTGPEGDAAAGSFNPTPEDVPKMVALATKIREELATLSGSVMPECTVDGGEFKLVPRFSAVVERMMSKMAPIVHEISKRSLTPVELVLRRALSSERREEIFVAKSTLRDKYAPLRRELRSLFDPLGFDTIPPPAPPGDVETLEAAEEDWPEVRAELAQSEPPPPPVPSRRPPPPPPRSSGSPTS
jgi:hypothetical protein